MNLYRNEFLFCMFLCDLVVIDFNGEPTQTRGSNNRFVIGLILIFQTALHFV